MPHHRPVRWDDLFGDLEGQLDELARQAEQQPPKALQAAAAAPPAPPTVDDLADLIKNQPDEMASLLRGWMGTSGAAR